MSKHSELLKDARELGEKLRLDTVVTYASEGVTVRALADTVERQDKVIAETVGACAECDEAIRQTIVKARPYPTNEHWINLQTAQLRARCAAKLAEPTGEVAMPSNAQLLKRARRSDNQPPEWWWNATDDPFKPEPAPNWTRYHELLDIMAKKGGLLSPDEQAEYDRFLPIIKHLDAEEGRAADAALDNLAKEHDRVIASIQPEPPGYSEFRDRAKAVVEAGAKLSREEALALVDAECGEQPAPVTAEPAPPIEVAMRTVLTTWNRFLWEARIGDLWIAAAKGTGRRFETAALAQSDGNTWLAALSAQLGVLLVGVWEGESQANTSVCARCRNEFDSTTTGLSAPMWPGCCGPCNRRQADDFASQHP